MFVFIDFILVFNAKFRTLFCKVLIQRFSRQRRLPREAAPLRSDAASPVPSRHIDHRHPSPPTPATVPGGSPPPPFTAVPPLPAVPIRPSSPVPSSRFLLAALKKSSQKFSHFKKIPYLCTEEKTTVGFSEKVCVILLGMSRLMPNGCNSTLNNQQPAPK